MFSNNIILKCVPRLSPPPVSRARCLCFLICRFLLTYLLIKSKNGYWIGLKDRSMDKCYWIDDDENVANDNEIWNEGEPNDLYTEDCAVLAERDSRVGADDVKSSCEDFYGICAKAANGN